MNNTLKGLLIAGAGLVAVGCNDTNVEYSGAEETVAPLEMNSIRYIDHKLNAHYIDKMSGDKMHVIRVTVQSKGMRSTPTGSLEVWAVLRNHTQLPMQLEGRAMFFDSDMVPTGQQSAWKRVYIPGNAIATYKESSISNLAANYVIELREGR